MSKIYGNSKFSVKDWKMYTKQLPANLGAPSENDLLVSEIKYKLEVTGFVTEIRRVENESDFDKLVRVIHHGSV